MNFLDHKCTFVNSQTQIMIYCNTLLVKKTESFLSMKIRVSDNDLKDAKRFDSFSSVIFNYKIEYCCFNKWFSFLIKKRYLILQLKMTLEKLSKRFASLKLISLGLIFMFKMFSTQIFSQPDIFLFYRSV